MAKVALLGVGVVGSGVAEVLKEKRETIARRVGDVPLLNLVLDSQSGTAGVETRLESFIDIIRFQEGKL